MCESTILKELEEIKKLTLLGAKRALTMDDAVLFTGLSKSHLYKLTCYKEIPHYKSQGGKLTFFDKNELENWLLNIRVASNNNVESVAHTYLATGKIGGN